MLGADIPYPRKSRLGVCTNINTEPGLCRSLRSETVKLCTLLSNVDTYSLV